MFFKIKSLYEKGVIIHLHCFEYGRDKQAELNKYCSSVTYYKRKSFLQSLSLRLPYIVSSRAEPMLLKNLLKDDHPVLLEGIHCTYFLFKNKLRNKKVTVRLHNVEYKYYRELANTTSNIIKKIYLFTESRLLKKYEKLIANKALFLAVSEKDKSTYIQDFKALAIKYLPVFLLYPEVAIEPGSGTFCLYQGNLSVPENEKAALWLLQNVFDTLKIPFVIAGKKPSNYLAKLVNSNKNVCLVDDPSQKEMDELIKKAHVHLLPSFNKTGIKIKLLNALFNGRFVITNNAGIEGTAVAHICEIANLPAEYKEAISRLFKEKFTEANIVNRKKTLHGIYNNDENVQQLMQWIW
ncbi:MAG: glycosyltransferase [Bacteroidota bacterium]|nr:glycosyltransferase [Bacteroidota bacterium]